jgi:organic radical activating enzyme
MLADSYINIAYPLGTTFIDYPDNESLAVIVYFMGCEQRCKRCHNPDFIDPNFSIGIKKLDLKTALKEIKSSCYRNHTNKIVLSGGDPLHPNNIISVKLLLEEIENLYNVVIYTSYEKGYITENNVHGFTYLKSGVFNDSLYQTPEKTDTYIKLASKNQKLYDADLNLLSCGGVYYFNSMR